ncbi:MAG: DUF4012 domain-containing protein, partial [Candidatus Blackburnbacteria bacterium]|nr:DUF4012 domain-containing protein [Candidatus Blackburnbacteria bacterium]
MDGFKGIKLEEQAGTTVAETKQTKDKPAEDPVPLQNTPPTASRRFNFPFKKKPLIIALVGFLVLLLALAWPVWSLYGSGKRLAGSGEGLLAALRSQDLQAMQEAIGRTKEDARDFDKKLRFFSWAKVVPFLGAYIQDADHAINAGLGAAEIGEIVIQTLEPYSDILGFERKVYEDDGATKTAEDRINFLVQTIEGITPSLDEISQKFSVITQEINKIDPKRYPQRFRGTEIREPIRETITLVNQFNELLSHGRPLLEKAPYLLGKDGERNYLFLWQNDKELRPTGGFITAYSIVRVKDGRFKPVASNDIYNLDDRLRNKQPAPEPIKKYLPKVTTWNLRDMNLSPDFKESMKVFVENYRKTRAPEFDGIVAIDTHLLVNILNVLGTIGVPGYGNYGVEEDSRCNCPNVIYELESFADVAGPIVWDPVSGEIVYKPPHADNRKEVLGPLMNSILANAMGQPKEKIPQLFEAGWNSMLEKHVLFYFEKEDVQKALEAFNLAGTIRNFQGDYLHISDTNFAGAKSNLYVQQEVELQVEPGKDGTTNTLTVRYKNPQKTDGWLNGPFRDWFRVYVPKGSTLVNSSGSEVDVTSYEELGKTVFEGFFILRPEGVHELKLTYKTPVKKDGKHKLLIQKQPGTNGPHYVVRVGKDEQQFSLKVDK